MANLESKLARGFIDIGLIREQLATARPEKLLSFKNKISSIISSKSDLLSLLTSEHTIRLSKAIKDAVSRYIEEGTPIKILQEEIYKALTSNKEFDIPAYKSRLLEVTYNKELYFINVVTTKPLNVFVELEFDSVAGSVQEYSEAVKATRKLMNMGKTEPDMASYMWAKKYYGSARENRESYKSYAPNTSQVGKQKQYTRHGAYYAVAYWETMANRLSFCKEEHAPFWYLINYGNHSTWNGDRGGKAYPIAAPTKFKEKAEKLIKESVIKYVRAIINSAELTYKKLKQQIDILIQEAKDLDAIITKLLQNDEELIRAELKRRYPGSATQIETFDFTPVIADLKSGKVIGDARGRVWIGNLRVRTLELSRMVNR